MTTSEQEAGGAPWTVSDTKNLKIQGELAGGALVAKASGRVDGGNAKDFQEALETMLRTMSTPLSLTWRICPTSAAPASG